jgi:hypothetical protein
LRNIRFNEVPVILRRLPDLGWWNGVNSPFERQKVVVVHQGLGTSMFHFTTNGKAQNLLICDFADVSSLIHIQALGYS